MNDNLPQSRRAAQLFWLFRQTRKGIGRFFLTLIGLFVLALTDIIAVCGAAAITYGVAQMHGPSAWIVGGLFALAAALRFARSEAVK